MTQKFTHKGYTLSQTDYNYHYMIFSDDGYVENNFFEDEEELDIWTH